MKFKVKTIFLIVFVCILAASAFACTQNTHNVTFVVDGSVYHSASVKSGKTLSSLPAAPTKTGFSFDAWYLDNDVWTQPFSSSTVVISDLKVYARFIPVPVVAPRTFTVTYDSMGGSEVKKSTVKEGSNPTLPKAPTRTDYNFEGWFLDKGYTAPFTADYEVRGDLTVYAKWTEVDSAVYFSHTGNMLTGITERGKKATVLTLPTELDGVTITSVRGELFKDNTSLTKVTVPVGYTTLGDSAFKGCTSLTSVNLGNSVINIGKEAFSGCKLIENLQLSTNLIAVPEKMCYGCTSLKYLNVGGAKSIGDYAYYGCTSLTSAAIPAAVTTIGKEAFRDCTALTSIAFKTVTENGSDELKGVTSIGEGAFRNCQRISSVAVPDTVTSLGAYAFYGITSATDLKVGKGITELPAYAFYGMRGVTAPVFDGVLTSIGDCCFMGMANLAKMEIPETVTSIGKSVFYNCNNLQKVVLPSAITSLKDNSFANCLNLRILDISNVTEIGNSVFYDCNSYKAVLPAGLTALGTNAFTGCKAIESLTIPVGITKIPDFCFSNCISLQEINFHDGVTAIGNSAFGGCKALEAIDLPASLAELTDQCFANCLKLANASIGATTSKISSTAFIGCIALEGITVNALNAAYESQDGVLFTKGKERLALYPYGKKDTEYVIPAGVKYISDNLFKENKTLTAVTLPDTVEEIGVNAFYECRNLQEINFPSSLKKIGGSAFYGCVKITSAELNVGIVDLGSEAFRECGKLESAVLPATLVSVGPRVFKNASAKLEITVDFPDEDLLSGWSSVWSDSGKSDIKYKVTYAKAKASATDYEYVVRDNKAVLLKYTGGGTNVTVPENIAGYPVVALAATFENNTAVTSVTVPDSIEVITERTFNGCTSLISLTIPFVGAYRGATGVGGIFGYIFDYSEDKKAGWSEHYTRGGNQTNYYCKIPASVKNVTVTDTEELAYGAFHNTAITSLSLPEGLKKVNTCALFEIALTELYIPASVEIIDTRAIMFKSTAETTINCGASEKPEGWEAGWYVYWNSTVQKVTVNYGASRA